MSYGERLFDNILGSTLHDLISLFLSEDKESLDLEKVHIIFEKLLVMNKTKKLKISPMLASKFVILAESIPEIRKSERFLKMFATLLKEYYIKDKIIYTIYEKEEKEFKYSLFKSIFTLLKLLHSVDPEK